MFNKKNYDKEYYQKNKEKLRENNKEYMKDYKNTERYKQSKIKSQKKYSISQKGREAQKRSSIKYSQTKKGKELYNKYSQTIKGKRSRRKAARRYYHKISKSKKFGLILKDYKELTKECSICGFNRFTVDVHHKDFNKENNIKENLIGLCPTCHQTLHRT